MSRGMAPANKGKSIGVAWLIANVTYASDDCLEWPFANARGYGHFKRLGVHYYAHRYMCELVHGPAPTPEHHAAHSCGRGQHKCVNPKHISWKTPSENQLDKRIHGRFYKDGRVFKLSDDQVAEIKKLKDIKTQDDIAKMFGVGRQNIGAILTGRSRTRKPLVKYWTPEEDERLKDGLRRGASFEEIGMDVGRSWRAVQERILRLDKKKTA